MPVTMRDVALRVGVSKQTVSAVVNGKSGISPETIARVKQAIAELGYQPNLVASSLRHGYTKVIGLLVANVANPWYAELARGVEDEAQARGYSVILCNTYDNPARFETYLRVFTQQRTVGVIGVPESEARKVVPDTTCLFQPVLSVDDRRGGYVATAHLLALGHRRVGCITAADTTRGPGAARLQGYHEALADRGIAADSRLIVTAAFDYVSGLRAIESLLQQMQPTQPPTAIFAHQDLSAIGVIAGLKRAGLRVPDDVAVIGYDGLEIAALYDPPLSTIIQPVYEIGRQAMHLLANKIARIADDAPAPPDCRLVVRKSTTGLDQEWVSPPIASGTPWQWGQKESENYQ